MKIFIANFGHETNTFSAERCDFERFAPNGWILGDDIIDTYEGVPHYLGGMISAAKDLGVGLAPGIAIANAGPLVTKECLDYICGELIDRLKQRKDEIDGVCLALHGAGCAETTDDLEGYTLEKVREVVGPDMPVTVALDLHGNITPQMVELSNGLFGIKEYPHIDTAQSGRLAFETLARIIEGKTATFTSLVRLPMFVAPLAASTFNDPMKSVKEYVAGYVKRAGLIDGTFFHGFPYQDVPYSNASVVVVADSRDKADAAAKEIAAHIWDLRETLRAESLTVDQAIDAALAELGKPEASDKPSGSGQPSGSGKPGKGYIVINESSDNPGGGAPCDGTHLLRALIRRNVPRSILGIIYDPEIARMAHKVGVGGRVSGRLGGKTDNIHGEPIELTDAIVLNLSDGDFICVSPYGAGVKGSYGKTARLRIGAVEVVVAEILARQTLDDRPFLITGADINQYDIVGVKSTNHFRAFFTGRAKAIVPADPPGIHTAVFSRLEFKNIQRPIYPIDPDAKFI